MTTAQRLPDPWQGCALWRIDLGVAAAPSELASLDAQERARAARFVFDDDRRRYQAAHAAMRALLAQAAGLGEPSMLRFVHNDFGKPSLADAPGCHFSLSHSGDAALLAIDAHAPVGVDVEIERAMDDIDAMAQAHFTHAERGALQNADHGARASVFLRTWTRKEACLKAIGTGLSVDPRQLETARVDSPDEAWLDDATHGARALSLRSGRLAPDLLYSVASTRALRPARGVSRPAEAFA
ncbi:MAG: 4'-phosphopantetheinyl transferase superfamily protein [Proteobacteria bacterium]|nr:4'-phosphopantetheinyl transferase superfamily protein [Pseudomonadota bacterium]